MKLLTLGRLFRSQNGFTLPEIMIGGAILAGVALAGATLFRNQTKSQTVLDHDKVLLQFHSAMAKILSNNSHCNATLQSFFNTSSVGGTDITAIKQCTSNCNWDVDPSSITASAIHSTNQYIDNTNIWTITKMSLPDTVTKTGALKLRMLYTESVSNRQITKDIILNVRFSNNQFKECFNNQESSVNNLQNDLCKSLSSIDSTGVVAKWDDETQSCKLVQNLKDCSTNGQMVEGVRSDGSVHCREISTGFNNYPLYDTTATDCTAPKTARLVFVSGKIRVVCQ